MHLRAAWHAVPLLSGGALTSVALLRLALQTQRTTLTAHLQDAARLVKQKHGHLDYLASPTFALSQRRCNKRVVDACALLRICKLAIEQGQHCNSMTICINWSASQLAHCSAPCPQLMTMVSARIIFIKQCADFKRWYQPRQWRRGT